MTATSENIPMSDAGIEAVKRERTIDYDPFSAKDIEVNLAQLAARRTVNPVTYSGTGGGFWVATGYDAIVSVLRNNNKGYISFPNNPYGEPPAGQATNKRLIPVELDGAEHRQYRKLLEPVFAPREMQALEPRIRKLANSLIDDWIEAGTVDFVSGFAFPYSATTIILLMGWPLKDAGMMNEWVRTLQHGVLDGDEEAALKAQAKAGAEVREYIMAMMAERRARPVDDFSTMLMNIELNGSKLSDDDLYDTFLLLMLAGLDTVQSALTQTFAYLGTHRDKWDEMFDKPETIDLAVEEFLRYTAPAVPTRTVTSDFMMVGDVPVRRGERVHCPLGAANRDPKYYPNPDEIDYDRPVKPHLAFGLGPHRCIGLHLARLEMKIAFEELHARMPRFSLDESHKPAGHLGFAWGVDDVYLSFPPGQRRTPPPA
jgi:cytochrome P450